MVPECTCIGDTGALGLKVDLKDGDPYGDLLCLAVLRLVDTGADGANLEDMDDVPNS